MFKIATALLVIFIANVNLLLIMSYKTASLKPLSVCCDIPELGNPEYLAECHNNADYMGPCGMIECIFETSHFLTSKYILNKQKYKQHLMDWAEQRVEWTTAVERAIKDCVDNEPRQYLNTSCKAYDVFTCTGIALLKKCPSSAWRCR